MIFGSGKKKKLALKMNGSVDIVKLILYKVFMGIYEKKFEDRGDAFYKGLAEASVNEVFSCHVEKSKTMFHQYMDMIIEGIEELGKSYADLKRPITDALRISRLAHEILTGEVGGGAEEIDNVTNRNLVLKGGESPNPDAFFEMVGGLAGKHYLE